MKASLFCTTRYDGPASHAVWPAPGDTYSAEWAERSMQRTLKQFELGDQLGFDWVTTAEHHFAPFSMTPNPMVMAAALTNVVKTAKIAVLGPDIPITDPVRVAEEMAMVDTMTGGRVIAGLMRGSANEYVTYNVNPAESRERFEEALQVIRTCWTETEPFGWQGRFYQYRTISIWPRPVQQPLPPIYISGSSRDSGEWAAKNRVGLGLAFTNLPLAAEAARFYRERCAAYGWEPAPDQIVYQLPIFVGETDKDADEAVRPSIERHGLGFAMVKANRLSAEAGFFGARDAKLTTRFRDLNQDAPKSLEGAIEMGTVICGGPKSVIAQVKRLRDEIGCGVLNLIFDRAGPVEAKRRSLELFAKEVMPEVRAL